MTAPDPSPPDEMQERLARWHEADFAAWLALQPPSRVVGRSRLPDCCPLATWSGFRVYKQGAAIGNTVPPRLVGPLPAWAERFRVAVDGLQAGTYISAQQALDLLAAEQGRSAAEYYVERIAPLLHRFWREWLDHLWTCGRDNGDGSFTIAARVVAQWRDHADREWAELSDAERSTDREQAEMIVTELALLAAR